MLYVKFGGITGDTVWDIDTLFNNIYEYSWLDDDLVRQMIKDIDNSDISGVCITSPVLGQIPITQLSGGLKALIFLLKGSDEELAMYPLDLMLCGENCQRWLLEVAKRRDIVVSCSTYDLTFEGLDIEAVCLNDNSVINSYRDWLDKLSEFDDSPDFDKWVEEDLAGDTGVGRPLLLEE